MADDGGDDDDAAAADELADGEEEADETLALAARSLVNIDRTVRLLAIGGWAAAGLWVVATITAFMGNWSRTDAQFQANLGSNTSFVVESNRVPEVIYLSLAATWQYLLIGVVALALSALVDVRRLPILLDDLD